MWHFFYNLVSDLQEGGVSGGNGGLFLLFFLQAQKQFAAF